MNPTGSPAQKDQSMVIQKEMIAEHYLRLEAAPQTHEPVVYTFVPGNLTELIRSFGCLPMLPEINALQSGMRGKSRDYIAEAEKRGHSEDVCTYVKCDIGMAMSGNIGPTGTRLPKPDLLLLSYTGCYTFMKWFELLREEYGVSIAGGQAQLKGKIIRFAHMGYIGKADLLVGFSCLEMVLARLGHKFEKGKGVAAAEEALLQG